MKFVYDAGNRAQDSHVFDAVSAITLWTLCRIHGQNDDLSAEQSKSVTQRRACEGRKQKTLKFLPPEPKSVGLVEKKESLTKYTQGPANILKWTFPKLTAQTLALLLTTWQSISINGQTKFMSFRAKFLVNFEQFIGRKHVWDFTTSQYVIKIF